MKSIKELEEIEKEYERLKMPYSKVKTKGRREALKDVLKLIDELEKYLEKHGDDKCWQLEELKSKIQG